LPSWQVSSTPWNLLVHRSRGIWPASPNRDTSKTRMLGSV
jgi:hypothetical protein